MVIELESVKIRISAPAHPSATGIGRVSGLASPLLCRSVGSLVGNLFTARILDLHSFRQVLLTHYD